MLFASTDAALYLRSLSDKATISIPLSMRLRKSVKAFLTLSRLRRSKFSTINTVPLGMLPASTCVSNCPKAEVGSRFALRKAEIPLS